MWFCFVDLEGKEPGCTTTFGELIDGESYLVGSYLFLIIGLFLSSIVAGMTCDWCFEAEGGRRYRPTFHHHHEPEHKENHLYHAKELQAGQVEKHQQQHKAGVTKKKSNQRFKKEQKKGTGIFSLKRSSSLPKKERHSQHVH